MEKSIPPSVGNIGSIITDNQTGKDIKAICNNCSKRFKSMRAITMHLKMTGVRHTVNFIDYGNYDSNTGMRKIERPALTNDVTTPQVPSIISGIGDLPTRTVINGRC